MQRFPFVSSRGASRDVVQERLNSSVRRRLSDDIDALIGKACSYGQFGVAEKLLDALRDLLIAEKEAFPLRRRSPEGVIEALASEIKAARERRAEHRPSSPDRQSANLSG